jgi:hypothetical protein
MVTEPLVDRKVEASARVAQTLIGQGAPLLAAYWDFREERGRWELVLVPDSPDHERQLVKQASALLIESPYRSIFSLSDPVVDSRQIERASALGAYIRVEPYVGRHIESTFTGGHYFESVVPIYFREDLLTHLRVA